VAKASKDKRAERRGPIAKPEKLPQKGTKHAKIGAETGRFATFAFLRGNSAIISRAVGFMGWRKNSGFMAVFQAGQRHKASPKSAPCSPRQ
jgi:hypothetical protein